MTDILQDISQYNQQISISQVVTFFNRKGLTLTKSMIQNYVRDGLLPPPVNKRYYTPKHMAALALIARLKTVYDLPSIKAALTPLMDNEGIPLELYRQYIQKTQKLSAAWQETIFTKNLPEQLLLMAHTADLKELSLGINIMEV